MIPPALTAVMKAALPAAIQQYQREQAEKARAAIEKQMARGKPWRITDDKAAAAMWRYMRAAIEGSARRNLDLLAEALVNGAVDAEFAPDEFKRQADRLDDLTRAEILVAAAFIRAQGATPYERYGSAVAEMIRMGAIANETEANGAMASLVRTGWVAPASGYGFFGYAATQELEAIARLVDFDSAATREETGEYD